MAYEMNDWSCGKAITTQKLKNMENGIAEGANAARVLTVMMSGTPTTVEGHQVYYGDHMANDIIDAFNDGWLVIFKGYPAESDNEIYGILINIDGSSGYSFYVYHFATNPVFDHKFYADNLLGYVYYYDNIQPTQK